MTLIAVAAAYALMATAFVGVYYATRHDHDYDTTTRRCSICGMDNQE